jgi:hypothetical protein
MGSLPTQGQLEMMTEASIGAQGLMMGDSLGFRTTEILQHQVVLKDPFIEVGPFLGTKTPQGKRGTHPETSTELGSLMGPKPREALKGLAKGEGLGQVTIQQIDHRLRTFPGFSTEHLLGETNTLPLIGRGGSESTELVRDLHHLLFLQAEETEGGGIGEEQVHTGGHPIEHIVTLPQLQSKEGALELGSVADPEETEGDQHPLGDALKSLGQEGAHQTATGLGGGTDPQAPRGPGQGTQSRGIQGGQVKHTLTKGSLEHQTGASTKHLKGGWNGEGTGIEHGQNP